MNNNNERQEFSVVVTGPIENGYLEFEDSNQCHCDNCDPNKPGFCLCEETEKIGQICQVKIDTINANNNTSFIVGPLEIKQVRFVAKKKDCFN